MRSYLSVVTSQCNAICMMENRMRKMRRDLSGDQTLSPVVKHTYLRAARGRKSFSKIITDISIILIIPDIINYPRYQQLSQISTIIPDINAFPAHQVKRRQYWRNCTFPPSLRAKPVSVKNHHVTLCQDVCISRIFWRFGFWLFVLNLCAFTLL